MVLKIICKLNTMQRLKENRFLDKFSLLSSQENPGDIVWSCSDSSEYENETKSPVNRHQKRKRKRKNKISKNIPNLDLTIPDSRLDFGNIKSEKSYGNQETSRTKIELKELQSPIIKSSFKSSKRARNNVETSPILTMKNTERNSIEVLEKSPILVQKFSLLRNSNSKVRKNLFNTDVKIEKVKSEDSSVKMDGFIKTENLDFDDLSFKIEETAQTKLLKVEPTNNSSTYSQVEDQEFNKTSTRQINEKKPSKLLHSDLINKVRSFFENQFSSESSQCSISDITTPKESSESKSDEIEILSISSQLDSNRSTVTSIKKELSTNSLLTNFENGKQKKVRYKKDGLAHRLNLLLKKQNANVTLWQHERYLAESSSFVIPKGENIVFRVRSVNFKYGCYLLDAVDVNEVEHLILINSFYAKEVVFENDIVFKLYEPYKILVGTNCNIVVNVCKFECVIL